MFCFVFSGCDSWLFEGVERQKAEELLALPSNRVGSFMVRESSRERGEQKTKKKHLLTPASAAPTRPSALCYGYGVESPRKLNVCQQVRMFPWDEGSAVGTSSHIQNTTWS